MELGEECGGDLRVFGEASEALKDIVAEVGDASRVSELMEVARKVQADINEEAIGGPFAGVDHGGLEGCAGGWWEAAHSEELTDL